MPRFKEVRIQRGLLAREVAQAAGIDEGLYSKIENHRALPTPSDLGKLLAVLGCSAEDVYDPDEITLRSGAMPTRPSGGARLGSETYKLTVRLSGASRHVLTREVLSACGYASINDWAEVCVRQLGAMYESTTKTPPDLPGGADGAG